MMTRGIASNRSGLGLIMRGVLAGVTLAFVFLAGYAAGKHFTATAQDKRDASFPLLGEAKQLLESNYLRELPPDREMEYGAIRGMFAELDDPYTFFIDPPVAQNESEVLAGEYGGIGTQLTRNEQGLLVLYPFPDGPADLAGILDGDILVTVNGQDIAPLERVDEVERRLRGEVGEGRGVELGVQAPGQDVIRTYFIEFEVVQVPSVVWRMLADAPTVGYVQILRFTSRTPDELRAALNDLAGQAMQALILDLRGNSGGLLQESVEVASEFVADGVIFYEDRRDGEVPTEASGDGTAVEVPLVVLVNQGTASASELVAGAIRDQGRGILIGQRTYGKGSVQLIFRLSDGSSVHITSAQWFTPARTPIDGNGLEPDIAMIPAEDGRDVELGEAVRYLQAMQSAAR